LLCDTDRTVGRAYGAEKGPDEPYPDFPKRVTFLIDPNGQVAKVYAVSDVGTHPDDVLADLRALAGSS